jgi:hypothetical protein
LEDRSAGCCATFVEDFSADQLPVFQGRFGFLGVDAAVCLADHRRSANRSAEQRMDTECVVPIHQLQASRTLRAGTPDPDSCTRRPVVDEEIAREPRTDPAAPPVAVTINERADQRMDAGFVVPSPDFWTSGTRAHDERGRGGGA